MQRGDHAPQKRKGARLTIAPLDTFFAETTSAIASALDLPSLWDFTAQHRGCDLKLECFPTPEFHHPFQHATPGGPKTRARKVREIMLEVYDDGTCCMREPVGECHPLAVIACSGNRPRWHITPRLQADVTVRALPWPPITTFAPTRQNVAWRVLREKELNTYTAEHDLREITDGMWSRCLEEPSGIDRRCEETRK